MHAMPHLHQILRGMKVTQGKQGRAPCTRLPITLSILKKMKAIWRGQEVSLGFNNLMLWAAASTTFFSFCCSGEVTVQKEGAYNPQTHLSFGDIAVDNAKTPTIISLRLKKSKTDQARLGVKIFIGQTGDDLCPVTALLRYLAARGNSPGPLFRWKEGAPLSKTRFVEQVRSALTKARLPADKFAGHSFRIGAATTAAAAGLEDSVIQTLGHWKSTAYLLYVRMDPHRLASVPRSLANCQI